MANYSNDDNLLEIRPDILDYNVDDWEHLHTRAKNRIDKVLESSWYQEAAADRGVDIEDTPFDADLLETTQLKYWSCYLTLSYIFEFLMKPSEEPDAFERLRDHYRKLVEEEQTTILAIGVEYDWDDDGEIDETERLTPDKRRLRRC